MKKTLTANLNNIVFNIDDDAFEVLNKYLADISNHFSSDEEKEDIMADIEGRIAELFNERLNQNKNVVTLLDVNEIINRMGKPSQFSDGETEEKKQQEAKSENNKKRKRFYRDPENSFLGGVGGGLAAYLDIDVTIIRFILVILIFLTSGIIIPIYIIVWFVAPEARTLSQRLEMQGEDATVENIKAEFDNAKNYIQSDNFKNSVNSAGRTIGNIIKCIIKAFLVFIGAVLAFIGIIIIAALFFALLGLLGATPDIFDSFFSWNIFSSEGGILLPLIALLFVIGCPVFILIYWMVNHKKNKPKTTYWITLILWLAGIFMLIGASVRMGLPFTKYGYEIRDIGSEEFNNEVRIVENFHSVNATGSITLNILQADEQTVISTYPSHLSSIKQR